MPLYDYRCPACGEFRAFRPMAESTQPQACPGCGAAAERALSAPFLGGGGRPAGWLAPQQPAAGQRVPWRAACGLGCNHVH